jgi:hypothetical protein
MRYELTGEFNLAETNDHEIAMVGEFPVAFEIEITLRLGGQGNDESELRPGAHHLRLEAAHAIARAAVAADLRVDIANGTLSAIAKIKQDLAWRGATRGSRLS